MFSEEFQLFNPWWQIKEAISHDVLLEEFNLHKYQYYHPFYRSFGKDKQGIFTVRGPRQVGKSTLLKLIIRKLLLDDKVNPQNIFFFPADRIGDYDALFRVILEYLELLRGENDDFCYLFLDEVSAVSEWQRAVKQLADMGKFKKASLILTGSNALDLKKSAEKMPGRKGKEFETEIEILPLTFADYLFLLYPDWQNQPPGFFRLHFPKVHQLFVEYLLCGGFPKSINEYRVNKSVSSSTFKLYKEWVIGDLYKAGKSEELALNILRRLFSHLTSTFSFYNIAEKAGINSHMTVIDYLDVFERMFVVFKLGFFSIEEKQSYPQKNKKAFFFDPLIYNTFRVVVESYLDEAFNYVKRQIVAEKNLPLLVENTVAYHLRRIYDRLYFGRLKEKEIDFVGIDKDGCHFFEVKYQREIRISDFSYWQRKEPLTVITKNFSLKKDNLTFIPLEFFLLSLKV